MTDFFPDFGWPDIPDSDPVTFGGGAPGEAGMRNYGTIDTGDGTGSHLVVQDGDGGLRVPDKPGLEVTENTPGLRRN